jgi:fluoride ion exporter CrcB/FEX
MGWVGVVWKADIAAFSELLVIGLSTGLMGSITTYASWNQALIFLVTKGLWVRSIVGLIIGKHFVGVTYAHSHRIIVHCKLILEIDSNFPTFFMRLFSFESFRACNVLN